MFRKGKHYTGGYIKISASSKEIWLYRDEMAIK
jgi:hypothetical protein